MVNQCNPLYADNVRCEKGLHLPPDSEKARILIDHIELDVQMFGSLSIHTIHSGCLSRAEK
jgi:hypothetical protein